MADVGAPPEVAALLLNWRGAALTLRCLADLLRVDGVRLWVQVIDNGSDHGRGSEVGELQRLQQGLAALDPKGHDVEIVALTENLGFAGGMNHGIARAEARGVPFVLVLNNDLRLPDGFLAPLCDVLRNDAGVAAVGPTVLRPDGAVWAEGGEVGFAPNALRLCRQGLAPRPTTHGPEEVGFLPGACVLLRTAALAAAGRFDERYFMYWEDVDLCARLRAAGGRVVWLPWVRVEHAAGASSGGGKSPLRKYLMACNAVRYLRAHRSLRGWAAWFCFDVLLWPLALLTGPRGAFAKLRGTVAGLTGHRPGPADVARLGRG